MKEYVAAHGGSVEVLDSTRGAHLRVKLPLVRASGMSGGAGRQAADAIGAWMSDGVADRRDAS